MRSPRRYLAAIFRSVVRSMGGRGPPYTESTGLLEKRRADAAVYGEEAGVDVGAGGARWRKDVATAVLVAAVKLERRCAARLSAMTSGQLVGCDDGTKVWNSHK